VNKSCSIECMGHDRPACLQRANDQHGRNRIARPCNVAIDAGRCDRKSDPALYVRACVRACATPSGWPPLSRRVHRPMGAECPAMIERALMRRIDTP